MADLDIQINQLAPKASVLDTDMMVLQSGNITYRVSVENLQKAHKEDVSNPHDVTKAQVGLGNVSDFIISDDFTGGSPTKYASEKAVTDSHNQLQEGLSGAIVDHIQKTDNPHNVTKTHIGLGSVSNYSISDAITFGSSKHYASSKAVKLAKEAAISESNSTIQGHKILKNNPHGVTKTHVGLNNINNYAITHSLGNSTTLYTSQAAVNAGLSAASTASQAQVDVHANTEGNPHNVTKTDVGLSEVPNWTEGSPVLGNSTSTFVSEKAVTDAITGAVEALRVLMLPVIGTIIPYNNFTADPNSEAKYAGTVWEKITEGYGLKQAPHSASGNGAYTGSNSVLLKANDLPVHTHAHSIDATDSGHGHNFTDTRIQKSGSGLNFKETGGNNNYGGLASTTAAGTANITVTGNILANPTTNTPIDITGAQLAVNYWIRVS